MKINARSLVSLTIAAGFLVLSGTGLLLFFVKHSNRTAAVHTLFGFVFLSVAALHIRNNFRALEGYGYKPKGGPRASFKLKFKLKPELYVAAACGRVRLGGAVVELAGFAAVYGWGNRWRNQRANMQEEHPIYQ